MFAKTAFAEALLSWMEKYLDGSGSVASSWTVIVATVSPGLNVNVPEVATFTVELLATDPSPYKYFSIQLSNASPNAMLVNDWANGYWYYDYGGGW